MASSSHDNPARPPPGQRLCALAEIADPGAKGFRFRADSRLFAAFLVRRGDDVSGWIDQCPHAGWPLGAFDDRYLTRDGAHILCTGHGGLFVHLADEGPNLAVGEFVDALPEETFVLRQLGQRRLGHATDVSTGNDRRAARKRLRYEI